MHQTKDKKSIQISSEINITILKQVWNYRCFCSWEGSIMHTPIIDLAVVAKTNAEWFIQREENT